MEDLTLFIGTEKLMEIHELREDFNKFNGGFKCHIFLGVCSNANVGSLHPFLHPLYLSEKKQWKKTAKHNGALAVDVLHLRQCFCFSR